MQPLQQEHSAQHILAMSQAMLELAQGGDWEAVADLQGEREEFIRALFAEPVPEQAVPLVGDCVSQVVELDAELAQLAARRRDEAAGELRELRHSQQGTAAYRRNSEPEVL